jgi:carboxypeptidase D
LTPHLISRTHRTHLCGYDVNLTYPQNGIIPTINPPAFTEVGGGSGRGRFGALPRPASKALRTTLALAEKALAARDADPDAEEVQRARKRDLSGRANGTIDPWYGCDTYDEMIDYALNFSVPWGTSGEAVVFVALMLTLWYFVRSWKRL